ncbi:MAG: hypothetical protein WC621_00910 [Patescibacteria group bacterium]
MLLDIVILPPYKIRNLVGQAVVKSVGDFKYKYIIDNKKLIPHVSLFHVNINKRKLSNLVAAVKKSINNYQPVKISTKNILVDGNGVWILLSNHKSLINLNRKMVRYCYPLRDGMIPWMSKRLPTKLEKFNREKYGTHYNIGKAFRPHFTMVKLKFDADAKIVGQRMKIIRFFFTANTIAICQVNNYCQVTKIIKKFKV